MDVCVGIDLGTTYCCVAWMDPQTGMPAVISIAGAALTPSVLCFMPDGRVVFGEEAKERYAEGDTNAVAFFKTHMGSRHFRLERFGKTYAATDLSSLLLGYLIQQAQASIGSHYTIREAVITVPAYFNHASRQATEEAGKKVGLRVLDLINEPTAAAYAYGLNGQAGSTFMVYDLGGGTFDVTVAHVDGDKIDVRGSDGNHDLGGKHWDDCLARYFDEFFHEEHGFFCTEDPQDAAILQMQAEQVKRQLTSRDEVKVRVSAKGKTSMVTVSEALFSELTSYYLSITTDLAQNLLDTLHLTWESLNGVLLVGGSTRMKMVSRFLTAACGRPPLTGINVDEAVALGAAMYAAVIVEKQQRHLPEAQRQRLRFLPPQLSDVTAHSMGMIAVSRDGSKYVNDCIIPRNSSIPATRKEEYSLQPGRKGETEIYVLQGDSEQILKNEIVGRYIFSGIEAVKGKATVAVSYSYTSSGIIEVTALQTENQKQLQRRVEDVPADMTWVNRPPEANVVTTMEDIEIMLAIDLSGSMSGDPLKRAKEAVKAFMDQLDWDYTKMGLILFADKVVVDLSLTSKTKNLISHIDAWSMRTVGSGNKAEPFAECLHCFGSAPHRYMIVLTDGVWNQGARKQAISNSQLCRSLGIEVIALGFGGADREFLEMLASQKDLAAITNLEGLTSSFNRIGQVIRNNEGGLRK